MVKTLFEVTAPAGIVKVTVDPENTSVIVSRHWLVESPAKLLLTRMKKR